MDTEGSHHPQMANFSAGFSEIPLLHIYRNKGCPFFSSFPKLIMLIISNPCASDYSIIVTEIQSMNCKEKDTALNTSVFMSDTTTVKWASSLHTFSHQDAVNKLLHWNVANLLGLDHQDSHISTVEIAFLVPRLRQVQSRILKHHFWSLWFLSQ